MNAMNTRSGNIFIHILTMICSVSALVFISGCGSLHEIVVPEDYSESSTGRVLQAEGVDGYADVFPELRKIQADGSITAQATFGRGKSLLQWRFLAAPMQGAMRLTGIRQGQTIFLVITDGMGMSVTMGRERFLGKIEDGSPFGQFLGVEPYDLARLIHIGWETADLEAAPKETKKKITIDGKLKTDTGLEWVMLDPDVLLPARAAWRLNGERWVVNYLEWQEFEDDRAQPMRRYWPNIIEAVQRRWWGRIRLTINVEKVYFDHTIPRGAFSLEMKEGLRTYPLELLTPRLDAML